MLQAQPRAARWLGRGARAATSRGRRLEAFEDKGRKFPVTSITVKQMLGEGSFGQCFEARRRGGRGRGRCAAGRLWSRQLAAPPCRTRSPARAPRAAAPTRVPVANTVAAAAAGGGSRQRREGGAPRHRRRRDSCRRRRRAQLRRPAPRYAGARRASAFRVRRAGLRRGAGVRQAAAAARGGGICRPPFCATQRGTLISLSPPAPAPNDDRASWKRRAARSAWC